MPVSVLSQIEELASRLSQSDRLRLIERLASAARQSSEQEPHSQSEIAAVSSGQAAPQLDPSQSHDAARQQAQLTAAWNETLRQMGISGAPVSAEKLRQMMIASGVNPEDNEFSREIIAMREE